MPEQAEILQYALQINYRELVVSLVVIAAVGVALYMLIKKVQDILGIETKAMREKREMHDSISGIKTEINQIKQEQEESRKARMQFNQRMEDSQKEVMAAINNLSDKFEKKEAEDTNRAIDNMRWTILEFANSIRDGKCFDEENYIHLVELYQEYEQILKANNLENGRVTASMKIINERYERGLREGFPI